MFAYRFVLLWGLLAVFASADRQVAAESPASQVYACGVEMGVPGLKPRPVADLAQLLGGVGFDGAGYAILTGPRLDETLRASDDAGSQIYLLQTAINVGPRPPRATTPRCRRPSASSRDVR